MYLDAEVSPEPTIPHKIDTVVLMLGVAEEFLISDVRWRRGGRSMCALGLLTACHGCYPFSCCLLGTFD